MAASTPPNSPIHKPKRSGRRASAPTRAPSQLHMLRLEERAVPATTFSGVVFLDTNANGRFDAVPVTINNVGAGTTTLATETGYSGLNQPWDPVSSRVPVVVRAFDATNVLGGTATTGMDGTYTLTVGASGPYRLEFSNLPTGVAFGPSGQTTGTAVQTVAVVQDGNTGGVNLALVNAEDITPDNPLLVTSCYVFGAFDGANAGDPVVIDFPNNAGATIPTPTPAGQPGAFDDTPPHTVAITQTQVGTTWGLAYNKATNQLYMAAFDKRHSGFGPGVGNLATAQGQIYAAAATPAAGTAAVTTATPLVNIEVLAPGSTGINYRTQPAFTDPANTGGRDPYINDGLYTQTGADGVARQVGWDAVGKLGLGGLDVDPTGRFLYTVALGDRKLYVVDTRNPTAVRSFDLPVPAGVTGITPLNLGGDLRPFAVQYFRGSIYVGAVNSGESTVSPAFPTGDPASLKAYVFQFRLSTDAAGVATDGGGQFVDLNGNPALVNPALGAVLTVPLNYDRGYVQVGDAPGGKTPNPIPAEWRPWSPTFKTLTTRPSPVQNIGIYPQPMLTGLAFDPAGNMTLGLRDRSSDQFGVQTPADPADRNLLFYGIPGGDTLKAFQDQRSAGGVVLSRWTLEANGQGPGGASAHGVGNGQGPGGGEFYSGDFLVPGIIDGTTGRPPLEDHQELSLGGVLQLPGYSELAVTTFDPAQVARRYNTAGVRFYANAGPQAGDARRGFELYPAVDFSRPLSVFAKANGVGDLVAISNNALEIGNKVFADRNRDGRQDATDPGLGGIRVDLFKNNALVATAVTDANGNYFFTTQAAPPTADRVPGKTYGVSALSPNMRYEVRIPLDQPGLLALTVTTANITGNTEDNRDSDALPVNGAAVVPVTTGPTFGVADHTNDAGFFYNLSIGDFVWEDFNNDGVFQAGEAPLAGVTVRLLDGTNGPVVGLNGLPVTTTTAADGGYLFANLAPGAYRIEVVVPAGYRSSTGPAGQFEPVVNPDNPGNNADHGTTQLGGAVVRGPVIDAQAGFAPLDDTDGPASATATEVGVPNANSYRNQDFGFNRPLSLGDLVFRDDNNSGMRDAGEAGVADVLVTLLDSAGATLATTTTNGSGNYLFTNLLPGTYQVQIAAPAGFRSSTGGAGSPFEPAAQTTLEDKDKGTETGSENVIRAGQVTLGAAGSAQNPSLSGLANLTQDFGLILPPPPPPRLAVGDRVFFDANNSGMFDDGEAPAANVAVRLLDAAGQIVATTATNVNGLYRFDGLAPGVYSVEILPPGGFTSSTGVNGAFEPAAQSDLNDKDKGTNTSNTIRTASFTLSPGGNPDEAGAANLRQDFGLISPPIPPIPPPPLPPPPALASISGAVFVDANVNGVHEATERPIPGTRVFLDGTDAVGNRVARTVLTDTLGRYAFANLPAGLYTVREQQPDGTFYDGRDIVGTVGGRAVGTLGNDILSAVRLNAGDAGVNYDFGEIPPAATFGYVWLDANRNGVFEPGETPIPGVSVTVSGTAFPGTPFERPLVAADVPGGLTAVTNAVGRYDFASLPYGNYKLIEAQPADYIDWQEQDGSPAAAEGRPAITNDMFTGVALTNATPVRGPFNFGETLVDNNRDRRRSPQFPVEPSKRDFLGSSSASGTGASAPAFVVPVPDQAGVVAPVADLELNPRFSLPKQDPALPSYLAVGAGAGTAPVVRVFDYSTGLELFHFLAYEQNYTGGVRTASGDINGDGVPDIITATGVGGGPRVRAFSGVDGSVLRDFFAYEPTYTGGLSVAAADVTGDGVADIVTGTDQGGGPRVRVFDGTTLAVVADFFAFDGTQRGGVRVAAADFNKDGRADIVAATGAGVPTRVRVFDGASNAILQDFAPYETTFTGGVYITAGDFNGDGTPDIVAGADQGGGPRVMVFNGNGSGTLASFFAFEPTFSGGVRVAAVDLNGDGRSEIVAAAGSGGGARVTVYSGANVTAVDDFFAFDATHTGGSFVGAGAARRTALASAGTPVAAGTLGRPGTLPPLG